MEDQDQAIGVADLETIVEDALVRLREQGYKPCTVRQYRATWRAFLRWSRCGGHVDDSLPKLIDRYLTNVGVGKPSERPSKTLDLKRSAMRLLEIFGMHSCRQLEADGARRGCSACALDLLIIGARREVERLGYNAKSCKKFVNIWHLFRRFVAQSAPRAPFSSALARSFLEHRGIPEDRHDCVLGSWPRLIGLAMDLLVEFESLGACRRRSFQKRTITLDPVHEVTLGAYIGFCQDQLHLRPWTLRSRRQRVTGFLEFLATRGRPPLGSLSAADLSAFVAIHGGLRPTTVASIVSEVRGFLRYLSMRGIIAADLITALPRIRRHRDARIPSVWKREDVDALLAAVDRASPTGKRDYAILLLACRLGLRVGDIRTLHLEDIDWVRGLLRISQQKTGTPLLLPLPDEVGEAICGYLKHGRPPTKHREVFLKMTSPFDPFRDEDNLHRVVTTYRRLAGIRLPPPTRSGLHALRHTMATRLLEAQTPFETISEILGHQSLTSTQIYTKVDIEGLRSAALDDGEEPEEGHG